MSYLVVEEGVWTIEGVKLEARTYLSTITDRRRSWVGEARAYGQDYHRPVVLGQVMSENDPDWSVFWCRGGRRHRPPSSSALWTGKTVCEDRDVIRADETVGYIVFEAGHGAIEGIEFEAFTGRDRVMGVGNFWFKPPYAYTFKTAFETAPEIALVTMAGVDGYNGGWAQTHGPLAASPKKLYLSIDEDQVRDRERWHFTEQVGYIVFEAPLVYRPR